MKRVFKLPYMQHYYSARSRCLSKNSKYSKYKIHFDMTASDVEFLWNRDKAYLMKTPSIDRIDTLGNYSVLNCRFIENLDNKKRIRRKSLSTNNTYKGVFLCSDRKRTSKKFRVICHQQHVGYFSNQIDAAKAYDNYAVKLGEMPINRLGG